METENCLIELPFLRENIDLRELMCYIRAELNSAQQSIPESSLTALATAVHQQIDKQSQIFYLLRLVLHETYFSQRKNDLHLADLNMEDVVNVYIGKIDCHQPGRSIIFYRFQAAVRRNSVQKSVRTSSTTSARRNRRSARWNYSISCRVTMNSSWNTFLMICLNIYDSLHHCGHLR
jgi:hypothetical protein